MPRPMMDLSTRTRLVYGASCLSLLALTSCRCRVPARTESSPCAGVPLSNVWVADQGDGTYKNPVLHADYSDPDVVRVGRDFYMVSSSFQCAPGLPILHSRDLVNWALIAHVYPHQPPAEVYRRPQPGCGSWAPAIRHHRGEFTIYYPDPDYGIYVVKAQNPAGPWSEPLLVKEAKGWIDPCPFWDDDGRAFLVNALAGSRSGIKSILVVSRMSPDGTRMLDDGVIVFDGHDRNPTVEGPKLYKRNGYYYIFAPAGGVERGWQLVLRSRDIYGPYEERTVLAQGKTIVNGPHQGAWVDTPNGEDWFIHFQDKGPYGRVVHLQPMRWVDDWPVMGEDEDGDGTGEPVLTYRKPDAGKAWPILTPPDSDEFNAPGLGLQWQWQANPQPGWAFPTGSLGFLRVFNTLPPDGVRNLSEVPNLLLQKFPAPAFTATAKVTFTPRANGDKVGLVVMGLDYAYIGVSKKPDGLHVSQSVCRDVESGAPETEGPSVPVASNTFHLRVQVSDRAVCRFSFSGDGREFTPVGEAFQARKGKWIGAKVGVFALRAGAAGESGYADLEWFRVE